MYTHQYNVVKAGKPVNEAKGALIMLHGRGGSAQDIVSLARELSVSNLAIYAPQASNNSWYPYSVMEDVAQNQPALDSALAVIKQTVKEIVASGIPPERLYFLVFSQAACLTLEYVARNAHTYGGVVAFTGGLIGKELIPANYQGDFISTPVLITTGVPDPHVPLSRVEESVAIFKSLDASVNIKAYPGRPHTITMDEIDLANQKVFEVFQNENK